MNLTKESMDWNIDSIVSNLKGRVENEDQLKQSLTNAIRNVVDHEVTLKSRKRVTRFTRSTKHSEAISHNNMIMKSLENAAENSKKVKITTFASQLTISSYWEQIPRIQDPGDLPQYE